MMRQILLPAGLDGLPRSDDAPPGEIPAIFLVS